MKIIKFYKNGELIYELQKINNLYILTDIKSKTSKSFNEIPVELENLLPEGINKELYAIKNNISIHNKFKLLQYLDDTFGRISTNNETKKEKLFKIKNIVKTKIKFYINTTPFEEFEKGDMIKNRLMEFFERKI